MPTLELTARGRVTLSEEVLGHLGVRPGDRIELDLLPDRRVRLRAARPAGTVQAFIGILAGRTTHVATLDEIGAATRDGWAEGS